MNFLAHAYLAGEDEGLIIGNFIADSVKGSYWKEYTLDIQKGILLHRKIDEFTDSHPLVLIGKRRLYKNYSKYSGVIIDIFLDHFLAANFCKYSNKTLEQFSTDFYHTIISNQEVLNDYGNKIIYYMQKNNWLLSYSSIKGIENTLTAMTKRSGVIYNLNESILELQNHYLEYETEFFVFFQEMILFVGQQKEILKNHGI
jgi:acyl carrier protein phosphodiesterase